MVKTAMAIAQPPHFGRRFANSRVALEAVAPATRMSLRTGRKIPATLTRALGVKLPQVPKTATTKGNRSALWLGPDEWLIVDDDPEANRNIMENLADLDCSIVDISHRNTAITIAGPGAENILSAGCPQDLTLEKFPVGGCSRTIFGKIEIILWRLEDEVFRVEVWRSFSDYLWTYLQDAAKHSGS